MSARKSVSQLEAGLAFASVNKSQKFHTNDVNAYWIWTGALNSQLMYVERSINKLSPSLPVENMCGKPRNRKSMRTKNVTAVSRFRLKYPCQRSLASWTILMFHYYKPEYRRFFLFRVIYSVQLKTGHCTWNVPSTQDITKRAGEKNRHDLVILSY